eukprot:scaffold54442_cov24-Tisochrysis_lutea.AAC.3
MANRATRLCLLPSAASTQPLAAADMPAASDRRVWRACSACSRRSRRRAASPGICLASCDSRQETW